jgi:hypothetical protein
VNDAQVQFLAAAYRFPGMDPNVVERHYKELAEYFSLPDGDDKVDANTQWIKNIFRSLA